MRAAPARPRLDAAWLRLGALGVALLVCVLLPFALWGDALERAAPAWLAAEDARLWIATVGVALLVADVALPVPSSLIAVALCWSLGPLAGGAAVALGGFLSFATGYGLGRLLPEARLRAWIGPTLWDRLRTRADDHAGWWIVLARPLPVLAELSAVFAGVWRLPLRRALTQAALASLAMGALYASSAWLGTQAPGPLATCLLLLGLPLLFWCAHRAGLRRLLSHAGAHAQADPRASAHASAPADVLAQTHARKHAPDRAEPFTERIP